MPPSRALGDGGVHLSRGDGGQSSSRVQTLEPSRALRVYSPGMGGSYAVGGDEKNMRIYAENAENCAEIM